MIRKITRNTKLKKQIKFLKEHFSVEKTFKCFTSNVVFAMETIIVYNLEFPERKTF